MADVKIVLNDSGVKELLKSSTVADMCMKIASKASSGCGEGYEAQSRNYPERNGAAVIAVTYQAKRDNAENNTILKCLGGGV